MHWSRHMIRSPEAMARKAAANIAHQRQLRAEYAARGLNSRGLPRQAPAVTPHHQTPEQSRSLGLEAILWMSTKKWRPRQYLLGIHAYGAALPLDWWASRMHFTIERLVEAIERERQTNRQEVA